MRVYFISPIYDDLRLFYKEMPDNTDVSNMARLNTGYNDSYEMRSQYIGPEYFSTDPKKLEDKLEDRKKSLIHLELMKMKEQIEIAYKTKIGTELTAIKHDSINSPF